MSSTTHAHTRQNPFTQQPAAPRKPMVDASIALATVQKAQDANCLAQECFTDLYGLFQAIKAVSDSSYLVRTLAGIGVYLADHWSDTHNSQIEEMSTQATALREAVTKPEASLYYNMFAGPGPGEMTLVGPYHDEASQNDDAATVQEQPDQPQQPRGGLLDAAMKLQALIVSGDICIRYPGPTNEPDTRRTALDDFALAVMRAREAHARSLP